MGALMKTGFFREHRGLFPIVFVALVSSGYLACGDETIEPTPLPLDAGGLDVVVPGNDGATGTDGSSVTDAKPDTTTADAPEDAPEDAPDDSPTSNGG